MTDLRTSVLAVAADLAAKDAKGFRAGYVQKQLGISKEDVIRELDELVAIAKLTRRYAASCSSCGRTLATEDDSYEAEATALSLNHCHSCDVELNEFLLDIEPVYTPTELINSSVLHETEVESGPRSRRSPLADPNARRQL